jgi:integrase
MHNRSLNGSRGGPRVGELVTAFLADQKSELGRGTYAERRRVCRLFAAAFGSRLPDSIRPSEVKKWILGRRQWRKPTTRWVALLSLKRLFNWAVNDRMIAYSPIRGLQLPQGEPRRATSDRELQVMLRHTDAAFRRVLIFMRATGCRGCEVCDLDWSMIDWQKGLAILPAKPHSKRKKKARVLSLPTVALNLLLWLRRVSSGSGPVFVNSRGGRWRRGAMAFRLGEIRKVTDLTRDATLHGLRHLVGSLGVIRGGHLNYVSKILGHRGTAVTEKFYVHIDADIDGLRRVAELAAKRQLAM